MALVILRAASGRIRDFTQVLFGKHLILTNATLSATLSFVGDGVQQRYEKLSGYQTKYQIQRAAHMTIAGLSTGMVTHFWYEILDKKWAKRTFRVVVKKVLYDQILFSPICIFVYFGTLALLERSSISRLKDELKDKGSDVYIAEWVVWPAAQFYNFYCLPLRYRVLFDNIISFGFDIYMPYIKYRDQRPVDVTDSSSSITFPKISEAGNVLKNLSVGSSSDNCALSSVRSGVFEVSTPTRKISDPVLAVSLSEVRKTDHDIVAKS